MNELDLLKRVKREESKQEKASKRERERVKESERKSKRGKGIRGLREEKKIDRKKNLIRHMEKEEWDIEKERKRE